MPGGGTPTAGQRCGEAQCQHLGLGQGLACLGQAVGLQQCQAFAQVAEQFIEAPRTAGGRRLGHALQARPCSIVGALGQFDLRQQQLQQVGVAAQAKALQLAQGAAAFGVGLLQLAERSQAVGAVEIQHRARCVVLGKPLQCPRREGQGVPQVAPQVGQAAAQKHHRLLHPLGVARHCLAALQGV